MKTITDGSAVFTVRDKRMQAMIDMFYPVGSVYISADKSKTKADFPFMQYGTWEEVPANLCLQTGNANEVGTQRSAGLPNITGTIGVMSLNRTYLGGAFADDEAKSGLIADQFEWKITRPATYFDASRSNFIYGASDTVQPPSYMVRAWIRTE